MIEHYKATIAIFTAFVTVVISPFLVGAWSFIVTTSKTNASVPALEARIVNLESVNYRMDERFKFIQRSLEVIQERDYKELKQAREKRLKHQ